MMINKFTKPFDDDAEKMRDFWELSKEEFLESYSYLTEEEYDATAEKIERERIDMNYWKDPRLDDEGTYDYLVEELPKDSARWEWYYCRCDHCGKRHYINLDSHHYFYCWDGWDSADWTECWVCVAQSIIRHQKFKIKRKLKALAVATDLYIKSKNTSWKNCYKIAKMLESK